MSSRPPSVATSRRTNTIPSVTANNRRPKIAPTKPVHGENATEFLRPASPPRNKLSKASANQDEGSNIQVVVRCRRRSEREIQEGSPVIVSTSGPRGEEVMIETGSSISTFGVITLPPTRCYPFDCVFGPQADQTLLYNDVVAPLLEQVLSGYNCTLFAYGQTGTGKTHTMQGDLALTHLGNPSPNAGMIPRTLFKLFQHLEANVTDYSVKLSFVELYNEELRDLLVSEPSTPAQASQSPVNHNQQLKIFDDNANKGVFIQGLEESAVKNAADAIALLTKGSQRRQIAATKFNDHSSRSHSIFSITVHLKETSPRGDDLLRVGKFNLVDLAGSENIGRSGAENKRAREAGMINQSLLTLGRVINALVEKSPHVPYRESKLTRLLQDSLGGRTKTCIIATISPVRSNLEETLSTLEYALRAKSIRNKPEINQRLTKNALLKEYVFEIERLKADLISAREMNGIYVSQESWDQMWAENEERQALYEETKREIASIEAEMRAVREEFEQTVALLVRRENELTETQETLRTTAHHLESTSNMLHQTQHQLQEEIIVRKAHQESEKNLDRVADRLKSTIEQATGDIDDLFAKLGRKAAAAEATTQTVAAYSESLMENVSEIETNLREFAAKRDEIGAELNSILHHFLTVQNQILESQKSTANEELNHLKASLETLHTNETTIDNSIISLRAALQAGSVKMNENFSAWASDFASNVISFYKGFQSSSSKITKSISQSVDSLIEVLSSMISETKNGSQMESELVSDLRRLITENSHSEVQRLKNQNQILNRLLQSERTKVERSRNDLLGRISGLLEGFIGERDRSLSEVIAEVQNSTSQSEAVIRTFLEASESCARASSTSHTNLQTSLDNRQRESLEIQETFKENLSTLTNSIQDGLTQIQKQLTVAISSGTANMNKHARDILSTSDDAFDQVRRAKRARVEASETMQNESQGRMQSLHDGLSLLSEKSNQELGLLQDKIGEDDALTMIQVDETLAQLTQIKENVDQLSFDAIKLDNSTGSTPVKKVWQYPRNWPLAGSRQDILWKKQQETDVESRQISIQTLPGDLEPDGDGLTVEVGSTIKKPETIKEDPLIPDDLPPTYSTSEKTIPQRLDPLREQPINLPRARSRRR